MKAISALVLIALLSGCTSSKVLDESRAKALVAQAPQTESYKIPVDRMMPAMARSMGADRSGPNTFLRRLIEAKLVKETVDVVTYPRISGTFASQRKTTRLGSESLSMQLQTVGNTNVITGTCEYRGFYAQYSHAVNGTVTPDGSMDLTNFCQSNDSSTGRERFQYSENGTTAIFGATRRLLGDEEGRPWVLSGTASGKVEVKWYTYAFSPEVQVTNVNQRVLVAGGRYEVGEVSNLRLVTETQATANFAWQAQLNQLGNILRESLFGAVQGTRPSGVGTAQFAKKPDGTWVLVQLNF